MKKIFPYIDLNPVKAQFSGAQLLEAIAPRPVFLNLPAYELLTMSIQDPVGMAKEYSQSIVDQMQSRMKLENQRLLDHGFPDYKRVVLARLQEAEDAYKSLGAGENLQWVNPLTPHDFPLSIHEAAYKFLDTHLKH
jgi:hypothetical protein